MWYADDITTSSTGKGGVSGACIKAKANKSAAGVMATCVIAMRALLVTEWEEAVSLAKWSISGMRTHVSLCDRKETQVLYGVTKLEIMTVLHSICSR